MGDFSRFKGNLGVWDARELSPTSQLVKEKIKNSVEYDSQNDRLITMGVGMADSSRGLGCLILSQATTVRICYPSLGYTPVPTFNNTIS